MFDSKEKRKFTKMAVSMGNDIYNYNTIIKLFKNKEDFQEALDKKYITICGKNIGYNSKVSIEKEMIEVDAQSNFNQNNP